MKKGIIYTLALLLVFGGLTACGKKTEETAKVEEKTDIVEEVPEEKPEEESEFYKAMQSDSRPIAVMIDNDEAKARPQLGLESAYLVYEMTVEGGATRFMALFKDAALEKIGPVRSSRHYFLDYVIEHDALYVHAGWSNKAAQEISSRNINNINGLYENIFWRDYTYDKTWHNLYTGLDKALELSEKKGYRLKTDVKPIAYNKTDVIPEGKDGIALDIPYTNFYKVRFEYDGETHTYKRFINGAPHMSQTGDALTAKNIIVYSLEDVPLNDGIYAPRRDIRNVGSGEGYYLSEGKAVPIKWSKKDRSLKTEYTLLSGEELKLNPGNTYIQIATKLTGYSVDFGESAEQTE